MKSPDRDVFVYLDIDGTLLYFSPFGVQEKRRGWAGQSLSAGADAFFDHVGAVCQGRWLSTKTEDPRRGKRQMVVDYITENFLPHLPSSARSFGFPRWKEDKTAALRADGAAEWVWFEDDDYADPTCACTEERDYLQSIYCNCVRIDEWGTWHWRRFDPFAPRHFVAVPGTRNNLVYALEYLLWAEEFNAGVRDFQVKPIRLTDQDRLYMKKLGIWKLRPDDTPEKPQARRKGVPRVPTRQTHS